MNMVQVKEAVEAEHSLIKVTVVKVSKGMQQLRNLYKETRGK